MIIYLIRHGRQNSTDCNVNVPLSAEGIRQAELLGERMKNYKIDALIQVTLKELSKLHRLLSKIVRS